MKKIVKIIGILFILFVLFVWWAVSTTPTQNPTDEEKIKIVTNEYFKALADKSYEKAIALGSDEFKKTVTVKDLENTGITAPILFDPTATVIIENVKIDNTNATATGSVNKDEKKILYTLDLKKESNEWHIYNLSYDQKDAAVNTNVGMNVKITSLTIGTKVSENNVITDNGVQFSREAETIYISAHAAPLSAPVGYNAYLEFVATGERIGPANGVLYPESSGSSVNSKISFTRSKDKLWTPGEYKIIVQLPNGNEKVQKITID